jgi:hypothetical protein
MVADSFYMQVLDASTSNSSITLMNDKEFTEFVYLSKVFHYFFRIFYSILKKPREVGTRLLNLVCGHITTANNSNGNISYECEVELLIRAHYCFWLSVCTEGIDLTLKIINERIKVCNIWKTIK